MISKNEVVGLFFGSFNPIHAGHLVIANYFLQFSEIEKIWFVVSPQNPLKEKKSLLDEYHRMSLVNEAIWDNPLFKACNIEFSLPKPSYTIHTLVHLQEKNPNKRFILIMGADNLQSLHKWKNFEQILQHFSIYVYPRPGYDGGTFKEHPSVVWLDAPLMEISSSFIREAIAQKKDMKYFLPEKVRVYIEEMHFYE
ncbi:MAG: nicotinate (nicotinamide) nucleotide adenylyltransferase [Bacteroidota bacterium]